MNTTVIAIIGVFIFLSYFIGAFPTGDSIGRWFANVEVSKTGSGKTGATNVMRATKDVTLGLIVFIIDAGVKGTLLMSVIHFVFIVGLHLHWVVFVCFAAVLLGHVFPLFTNFKTGGAGIATIIGGSLVVFLGLPFLLAITAWCLTFHFSRGLRSLCNIAAASVLLFSGALFDFSWEATVFALFATSLILFAHRSNLKRIKQGTEDRSTWESLGKKFLELGIKIIALKKH